MEENKTQGLYSSQQDQDETSSFDFKTIYTAFILNWKWFAMSVVICLGVAVIYLRYATPKYQASAKLLIKDDDNKNGSSNNMNSLMASANLGIISASNGIDNEIEILKSLSIATEAVRDLKLYVTYKKEGKITDKLLYKTEPIAVDLDSAHVEKLKYPVDLEIIRKGNSYEVNGKYLKETDETSQPQEILISKKISILPSVLYTKVGAITFNTNGMTPLKEGEAMKVTIMSPKMAAGKYVSSISVSQTSKTTTIAEIVLNDEIPQRAVDYLQELTVCYNNQANEDKNEIAIRTEAFINGRLAKINAELGDAEGSLESYKKRNRMVELQLNAAQAVQNQDVFSQKLAEANTQVALLNSINDYMNQPENKYEALPSNVGLTDQSATSLIDAYNKIVLQRNRLLRSASENSPVVTPLTAQLDDLANSIRRAMNQARRSMAIERRSIEQQYGKYSGQISSTPEQERMLNQIGRQQTVKSGLYLTLLQKREENSISLAATADKGSLIDEPQVEGKTSPKSSMIMLIALIVGIGIPAGILFLINYFRYKIEGHDDVEKLTKLPIIADVAVANEGAKSKADIVVHENKNNQMEETFRSMRTNIQFMLEEDEKVIMFTSCNSGEGKTFNAANLAVSFALLDKKVVLIGLDIRKPRLANLFKINDRQHGITNLLIHHNVTDEDVKAQIIPSGINGNLDLLMAGPIPPNPTELVARKSLDNVINILKQHYDYIIIDTAPVGLVSDTLQIGRVANITVFVCRADYTPKAAFEFVNTLSEEKRLPNMCIAINGIDMSKKKYGYYYGYTKYSHYGHYSHYSTYSYGSYRNSGYANKNDKSIKQ